MTTGTTKVWVTVRCDNMPGCYGVPLREAPRQP
jgi:hypothetical protein